MCLCSLDVRNEIFGDEQLFASIYAKLHTFTWHRLMQPGTDKPTNQTFRIAGYPQDETLN